MPIYMKYEGIDGAATGKYKGWIELESCQMGNYGAVGAGRISVSEVIVSKFTDKASAHLFKESLSGTGKKVVIDFIQEGESAPYLSIELENTIISSFSLSGTNGSQSKPIESLSLNFTKLTYSIKPVAAPKGSNDAKTKANWNWAAP